MNKPSERPINPQFSSGPARKNPTWSWDKLSDALTGRSHRSSDGKLRLFDVIEKHREILEIPADYKIAIVPASDTGAVEMAMWSMLGARGVDILEWENFSKDWATDAKDHMKLDDFRILNAPYGEIPDLNMVDFKRDVVFPWNGTTSGARIPNHDWIPDEREGLTICDATSAIFAYEMDWSKLDVTTWSWQKVLGGEAAHGMLVLSPRAIERLENYIPNRALPKIFRMTKGGKLNEDLFKGVTINTPSMIAVEDCLVALEWVESIGGVNGMIDRSRANLHAVEEWVAGFDWIDFLTTDKTIRSSTALCLRIIDPEILALPEDTQTKFVKDILKTLDEENAAKDMNAYKTAPLGFRIWGGGTVDTQDIKDLLPWLEWAYEMHREKLLQKVA